TQPGPQALESLLEFVGARRMARAPPRHYIICKIERRMNAGRLAVGVVMPVRNGARTLAAAIRSVCSQRPAPADIVVIDGGSEDDSATLAAAFPDVRVIAQIGLGLAAARNQGLRAVKGEAIAFCDSDDRWTDGALAARLNHLATEP